MMNIKRTLNMMGFISVGLILLGALAIQYFWHEEPCPLCLLQRLGMMGIAVGFLMNYRFGISARHYGVALLSAFFGAAVALRQIVLHIIPGSGHFGTAIFGLHLYTWSFLAYVALSLLIVLLLLLDGEIKENAKRQDETVI